MCRRWSLVLGHARRVWECRIPKVISSQTALNCIPKLKPYVSFVKTAKLATPFHSRTRVCVCTCELDGAPVVLDSAEGGFVHFSGAPDQYFDFKKTKINLGANRFDGGFTAIVAFRPAKAMTNTNGEVVWEFAQGENRELISLSANDARKAFDSGSMVVKIYDGDSVQRLELNHDGLWQQDQWTTAVVSLSSTCECLLKPDLWLARGHHALLVARTSLNVPVFACFRKLALSLWQRLVSSFATIMELEQWISPLLNRRARHLVRRASTRCGVNAQTQGPRKVWTIACRVASFVKWTPPASPTNVRPPRSHARSIRSIGQMRRSRRMTTRLSAV